MSNQSYTFFEDSGHGWLRVPKAELRALGIAAMISGCSYQSQGGAMAYLEEDCDLSTFLQAKHGLSRDGLETCRELVEKWWAGHVTSEYYDGSSRIRRLPNYKWSAAA